MLEIFKTEARALAGIVGRVAHGRLMDLACGTAYWLPHDAPNCSRMTLFDQSGKMLTEGRAKADRLGIVDRCVFAQGDLLAHAFEQAAYDTVLVGFFLSHLTETQDLFDAYPRLTREDIQAAMRYAADTIAHEEVVFIGKSSGDAGD